MNAIKKLNDKIQRGDLFRVPVGPHKGKLAKVIFSGNCGWIGHHGVDGVVQGPVQHRVRFAFAV